MATIPKMYLNDSRVRFETQESQIDVGSSASLGGGGDDDLTREDADRDLRDSVGPLEEEEERHREELARLRASLHRRPARTVSRGGYDSADEQDDDDDDDDDDGAGEADEDGSSSGGSSGSDSEEAEQAKEQLLRASSVQRHAKAGELRKRPETRSRFGKKWLKRWVSGAR